VRRRRSRAATRARSWRDCAASGRSSSSR
jgi:hypothetical protein